MLASRFLAPPRSLITSRWLGQRPLNISAPVVHPGPRRAPSLAQITPDGVQAFDARQKEFRARTAAAQKAKEQQDSQFVRRGASIASAVANAAGADPNTTTTTRPTALGSLGTHETGANEAEAAAASQPEHTSRAKDAISSLIYGTQEGRQMDRDIERSYSQVLMRGKYVHSIVFHKVKPDKVDEYIQLVGRWYPRMASMDENKVNLVGSWRTEVGDCDTFGV